MAVPRAKAQLAKGASLEVARRLRNFLAEYGGADLSADELRALYTEKGVLTGDGDELRKAIEIAREQGARWPEQRAAEALERLHAPAQP